MATTIQPLEATDVTALGACIDQVCAESPWMATTRFLPTPAWEHALKDDACPRHAVFVIKDDGRVVGWCRLFPESCETQAVSADLGIGLLPAYRRQGFGTRLVQEALDIALRIGCQRITLDVHPENTAALRLFQRFGFNPTERIDRRIFMACELSFVPESLI